MNLFHTINSNESGDISIGIPEEKLEAMDFETGRNGHVPTETIALEPEIEKADSSIYHASRRKQGNDNDENDGSMKNEEDDDEDIDESDGSKNKDHFVNMEEEDSNVDVEIEETKKQSSSYAAKKTVAQGMMDIALITANANQLRYIIEFNSNSSTYYFIVTLIVISLGLQVAVGVALIFKGRLDIKGKSKDPDAKRINNYVVVAIFLVTIINVFIASFTITGEGAKKK